jgi:hypothetical protein
MAHNDARNSDGSGSIDRDEFLQIPQIASNPLALRMIAIFDEECVAGLVLLNRPYISPWLLIDRDNVFVVTAAEGRSISKNSLVG